MVAVYYGFLELLTELRGKKKRLWAFRRFFIT